MAGRPKTGSLKLNQLNPRYRLLERYRNGLTRKVLSRRYAEARKIRISDLAKRKWLWFTNPQDARPYFRENSGIRSMMEKISQYRAQYVVTPAMENEIYSYETLIRQIFGDGPVFLRDTARNGKQFVIAVVPPKTTTVALRRALVRFLTETEAQRLRRFNLSGRHVPI